MPLQGMWELVDGEPVGLTPAAGRSSWIAGRLFAQLERYADAHKLGWVFPADAGFVLFEDRATVRSPDAAFVRGDRLAEPPDSFVPLAPDLAVEVLSPSDRMGDALAKISMYLQTGVQIVWLVDPASETVTVFHPDAAPVTRNASDTLGGGVVLPGFSLPVADIFP
jgi:Uma2 family endonuclease